MTKIHQLVISSTAVVTAMFTTNVFAVPIVFTQHFPGGFDVSINGGALTASGPITVTGVVDDTTADIDPSSSRGEFPLTSVSFTGAGFVDRGVTTPLSLLTFSSIKFAFQRVGEFNEGIIGWNGSTSSGAFMTNVNDLSTLIALPYTTSGTSTFWHNALGNNAWTLALGGDTIGAARGSGGPTGTFSINNIPEPTTLDLDIKPGPSNNTVPLNGNGTLQMAILANADFDVLDIDIASLLFGDPILVDGGATPLGATSDKLRDLNHDGLDDLLVGFSISDLVDGGALDVSSVEGRLTGELFDGTRIVGSDIVRMVPQNNGGGRLVSSAVPEPTTSALALAALCLAISRRRSH